MSYENFKQKIWSKAIDTDLKRVCVYAADTNQEYEGAIEGLGDTVRILGVGKPEITTADLSSGTDITLSDPEKVADTSVSLVIEKISYFNYAVGDIDKAQGAGKVLETLNTEASEGVASKMDSYIADLSKGKVGVQKYANSNTVITDSNVLDVLDACQQKLFENDVAPSTPVTVTMPPWLFTKFRKAYRTADTDNSKILKNGQVAMYGNMVVRMSNNVAKNASDHHLVQVKTKRAIAFAQGKPHVEPYRPEKKFEDAVKGFVLYGAKIVRPKEMVTIECSAS